MIIIIFIQTNIQYFRRFSSIGNHCFANKSHLSGGTNQPPLKHFFNKSI